jgi:hypothetical protein
MPLLLLVQLQVDLLSALQSALLLLVPQMPPLCGSDNREAPQWQTIK